MTDLVVQLTTLLSLAIVWTIYHILKIVVGIAQGFWFLLCNLQNPGVDLALLFLGRIVWEGYHAYQAWYGALIYLIIVVFVIDYNEQLDELRRIGN